MPLFRYEAKDKTGRTVVGAMQVADETTLQRKLTAMGYLPLVVHPAAGQQAASTATGVDALPQGRAAGCDQPVPSWALVLLYEELWATIRAGISLSQSLAATADRLP